MASTQNHKWWHCIILMFWMQLWQLLITVLVEVWCHFSQTVFYTCSLANFIVGFLVTSHDVFMAFIVSVKSMSSNLALLIQIWVSILKGVLCVNHYIRLLGASNHLRSTAPLITRLKVCTTPMSCIQLVWLWVLPIHVFSIKFVWFIVIRYAPEIVGLTKAMFPFKIASYNISSRIIPTWPCSPPPFEVGTLAAIVQSWFWVGWDLHHWVVHQFLLLQSL